MPIDLPPFDISKLHIERKVELPKPAIIRPKEAIFFPGIGFVMAGVMGGLRAISSSPTTVVRTSGTSWSIPSNYQPSGSTIDVYGAGGGSSGGCYGVGCGGGGGGGGFSRLTEVDLTPGGTLYHSIGAGGAGGAECRDGSSGGKTWVNFGSYTEPTYGGSGIKATGGSGSVSISGGNGGTGLYGHINRTGGKGGTWVDGYSGGGGGGGAGTSSNGGDGTVVTNWVENTRGASGGGYAGQGGQGQLGSAYPLAEPGYDYGGGGGGAGFYTSPSKSGRDGYDGAQGVVVITYYAYL